VRVKPWSTRVPSARGPSLQQSQYAIARHLRDEVVPLAQRISEETLLRYNGMLIGVFECWPSARSQMPAVKPPSRRSAISGWPTPICRWRWSHAQQDCYHRLIRPAEASAALKGFPMTSPDVIFSAHRCGRGRRP